MADVALPDVNVLVALLHPDHVHHRLARAWFDTVALLATTPITESGFLRLALNPLIGGPHVTTSAALTSLRSLRAHERSTFLPDDSSLAEATLDLHGLAGFKQVTDYHLLNLAARHSARFVTFDAKIRKTLPPESVGLVDTLA